MVKKILFIGDTFCSGKGAEWPGLYNYLKRVPPEFLAAKWSRTLKQGIVSPEEIITKFADFKNNHHFDFEKDTRLLKERAEFSWPSMIAKHFNLEYSNEAFDAKSNFHIANILTRTWSFADSPHPFEDTLVVLGVTDAIKELTFYQNLDQTKALKNITIPQLAFIINYIKEYVTNRGGKFVYFHVDSFPAELYDPQLNPFYYNISPYMLLESNLHEAIPRHLEWKRWDGIHFDKNGHKWLANYLIKQLENSDFIHILR